MSGGVFTSSIEIVRPDRVANRKPRSLIRSRLSATSDLRVVRRDLLDDRRDRRGALADDVVHVAEADRQRLVEEQPPGGRLELFGLLVRRRVAVANTVQRELEAVGAAAQA